MKAEGSQQIAQKASCLVLDEGQKQSGKDLSHEMLQAFSVKLSTALMELEGDERVAAAAALAVLESQPSVNSGEPIEIDNNKLFNNLYETLEATTEGKYIINHVKRNYPKLNITSSAFKNEVLTYALQLKAVNKVTEEVYLVIQWTQLK